LHRLSSSFVLGYHGCDIDIGERLLSGVPFKQSENGYDWLGPGIYFWEANPQRGFEFAKEASGRKGSAISTPFVIGAVIELGLCLDLTTSSGVDWIRIAFESLVEVSKAANLKLPANSIDQLRRNLDCAVVQRLHTVLDDQGLAAVDTVKGVFVEGQPAYPGAGFAGKTHIQIAVRNPKCIKGVFRVPLDQVSR